MQTSHMSFVSLPGLFYLFIWREDPHRSYTDSDGNTSPYFRVVDRVKLNVTKTGDQVSGVRVCKHVCVQTTTILSGGLNKGNGFVTKSVSSENGTIR